MNHNLLALRLGFPVSRTMRNQCPLFKLPGLCHVIAAGQTDMPTEVLGGGLGIIPVAFGCCHVLSTVQSAFHKLLLFFTVVMAIRCNFPWFKNKETDPGKSTDLSKATQLAMGRAERRVQTWLFQSPWSLCCVSSQRLQG